MTPLPFPHARFTLDAASTTPPVPHQKQSSGNDRARYGQWRPAFPEAPPLPVFPAKWRAAASKQRYSVLGYASGPLSHPMNPGSSPTAWAWRAREESPQPAGAPHYRAFISYSHADTKWANWLLAKLEGYRVPARFHGQMAPIGVVGPRLAPVFRDRDELPSTSDLSGTIRAALQESASLIVVCSPNSAKSRWVREEIVTFKRMHGGQRVFAFIVEGEPKKEGAPDDCFSPALRRELGLDGELSGGPAEVVAADARPHADGKNTAFLRLVAGMLGVGFDELRQRELQRRNRRLMLISAASVAGMVVTLGLAVAALRAKSEAVAARNEAVLARNDAVLSRDDAQRRQGQAEDLISFIVGDYRQELQRSGTIGLLAPVDTKVVSYFAKLNPRDLTDTTLSRQAKALYQIGATRLGEVRYNDAADAFAKSYDRAAALASRHPKDAGLLRERQTAEKWLCQISVHRGDLAGAREWAEVMMRSALALVALEGSTSLARAAQTESEHNLAICDFLLGNYEAARSFFLKDRAAVAKSLGAVEKSLVAESRWNPVLDRRGGLDSLLGEIAEFQGDYTEALARAEAGVSCYTGLAQREPAVANWRLRLARAHLRGGIAQALAGRWDAADAALESARALFAKLVADDPKNVAWLGELLAARLRQAELLVVQGRGSDAVPLIAEACENLETLVAKEPTSLHFRLFLVAAWRTAALNHLMERRAEAGAAVARACAVGDDLMRDFPADRRVLGEATKAHVLAGRHAAASGQIETAQDHWRRALDALSPQLENSGDWRHLDPAAQALVLLGRSGEARPLVERLRRFGYHPINPLAASTLAAAFPNIEISHVK